MQKDNSKKIAIILVIITTVVLIINFVMNSNKQEENKISIVTNYSDFYTVNSCIYRTLTYLSSQDKENLLLLLSDSYKKENNVTIDNVMNVFFEVGDNPTFESRKMYYEKITDNIVKYYVMGYVNKNEIYIDDFISNEDITTTYFIVYLNTSSGIFSIEPYEGNAFKEGETNE